MATNLNYNVNVNATNGIQALNNLQNKVQGLNSSFGALKNAFAGLAIGQVIANLGRFADGISDLSDATGIAIQNILGFQKAVKSLGGDADTADKGILKLVTNIGAAAEGSAELQYAFGRVGVTLQDLATLSEQDILRKTIEGIGNISNVSERAILVQQLLGKEFRNVKTGGDELGNAYASATDKSEKNAKAVKAAADAYDNFDKAIGAFKTSIIQALNPISEFIAKLDPVKIQEFADTLGAVAVVMTSWYGLGKIIAILEGLSVGAATATTVLSGFAAAIFTVIRGFFFWISLAAAVNAAIKFAFDVDLVDKFAEAVVKGTNKVKDFFNIKTEAAPAKELKKVGEEGKKAADGVNAAGNAARNVVDPFAKLRSTIRDASDDFAKMNAKTLDQINLNNQLIGATLLTTEVTKAQEEIYQRAADASDKLRSAKEKLSKEEKAAGVGAEYDKQIAKIVELAEIDAKRVEEAVKNSQRLINARKLEEFAIQSQIDVNKDLRRIQDDIAKSTMSEIERKQYDILAAARERANVEIDAEQKRRGGLLTDAEKLKYYEAAKKGTQELINKESELYSKSREFSTGWKRAFQEYVDNATNAARVAENLFKKATQGMEDLIVNFAKTGKFEWKGFVASMLEELLRAQIQQIFAGLLGGMSGSMKGNTGGALGGLLGGGDQQDSGGVLGALGGLFGGGGAAGSDPSNPMYVIDVGGGNGGITGAGDVLGEQGGGFLSTVGNAISGVWNGIKSTAGSVWEGIKSVGSSVIGSISNVAGSAWEGIKAVGSTVASGIGSAVSGIGDWMGSMGGGAGGDTGGSWLGDVASGIGDFFGGFFANGGQLGAGKWGIAGENGPEIISGPASVSPMGGGTNVTYNINAVDAMSFKQMLAQDPSFIYGLTLQGSKGVAARR